MYACETWATTKRDENKLAIFKRRIYGLNRNNITQQYEKRDNIVLQQSYKEPDIFFFFFY